MLSDTIERKFTQSFDVDDYEILTDTGWRDIKSVHQTVEYKIWVLTTTNCQLKCADTHIVFRENGEQVFVKDLLVGDKILTESGVEEVVSVVETDECDNMYDVEVDDENHRYYTNGILSHNTTSYTIFALWLTTLFSEKKIMICANKLQTALEIMSRIRTAYEYLPEWIKPGVVSFNKSRIEFANMSSIEAFSTSSSGARGSSANCVTGDTKVTVMDDFGNIYHCDIGEVENIMNANSSMKVSTSNGFKEFKGIRKTKAYILYHICFSDGSDLKCTEEHRIKLDNNQFEYAKNIQIGFKTSTNLIVTKISYEKYDKPQDVYDLLNVEDGSEYKTNNVDSHNCLIIDEMAFIPKNVIDPFFTSVMPIVSSSKNSKVIVVSTPNGSGNLYYDLWMKAKSHDSAVNEEGWSPFRMYWWEVPGRDEQWKNQQIATIGMQRWNQEFECEFVSASTKKLIPDDIIEKYRRTYEDLKRQKKAQGTELTVESNDSNKSYTFTMWHEYQPHRSYIASGDISEGGGGDSSVVYVWDVTELSNITMCAMFASNSVTITEYEFILMKILALYNNPWFNAERNGIGAGVLDHMEKLYNYPRLVREGKGNSPGTFSHPQTKSKACLWTQEMMTTDGFGFIIYDEQLLEECSTFVKKDTKVHTSFAAVPGTHDDRIMTLIWMCYILQRDIIENYFVVVNTFTSQFGIVYPLMLRHPEEPTNEQLEKINRDPLYKQFLEMKREIVEDLKRVAKNMTELKANNKDLFFREMDKKVIDPYFGDEALNDNLWGLENRSQASVALDQGSNTIHYYIV